jgi:hypothetical protein
MIYTSTFAFHDPADASASGTLLSIDGLATMTSVVTGEEKMTIVSSKGKFAITAAVALAGLWMGGATAANAGTWVQCAQEGGFCRAPYGALIHFGAHGVWASAQAEAGGLPCSRELFGDPLPGYRKWCFVLR